MRETVVVAESYVVFLQIKSGILLLLFLYGRCALLYSALLYNLYIKYSFKGAQEPQLC